MLGGTVDPLMFADVMDLVSDRPFRVMARISFRRTEDGGRPIPVSGSHSYRPNHNFGDASNHIFYIGQVEIPRGTVVHPGDVVEVVVNFLDARGLSEMLQVGRTWRIQEGAYLVATAEVLERLPAA